jgi:hypothetical protein
VDPRLVATAKAIVICVAAVVVAAGLAYLLLWYGPDAIAVHDVGHVTGSARVVRLQDAKESARASLLTLGAGLFAAGALVYTGRNFTISRRTLQISQRTFELAEQGQVTDRYTNAIGQLGSRELDVRIGAIYGLERVAHDSARDHPTVMEVLAAFVREHSREEWPGPMAGTQSIERATRPDVQAAVTVIARRNTAYDRDRINLDGSILPAISITAAKFSSVDLAAADLRSSLLAGADLSGADLTGADLTDASLPGSDLTGADLAGADLTNADLTACDLTEADLTGAVLRNAYLVETELAGAFLTNVDLTATHVWDANLGSASLTGVHLPFGQTPPEGWAADSDSGRLSRSPAQD